MADMGSATACLIADRLCAEKPRSGCPSSEKLLLIKNAAFDDGKNAFAATVRCLSTRIK